jgi:hypothetical protein
MNDTIRSNPTELHRNIQLARAAAIEAYSDLERQLCLQFSDLMGANYQKGEIVFYKITNTFSRNRILQSLLEAEFGKKYKVFWGSLIKLIRQLDHERNKIVHWHIIGEHEYQVGDDEDNEPLLVPHGDSEEFAMTAQDLWEFVNKTEYVRLQAIMFHIHHLQRPSPEAQQANPSYEIFQLPCLYPPPTDRPGFHFGPIPSNPPQSSEG